MRRFPGHLPLLLALLGVSAPWGCGNGTNGETDAGSEDSAANDWATEDADVRWDVDSDLDVDIHPDTDEGDVDVGDAEDFADGDADVPDDGRDWVEVDADPCAIADGGPCPPCMAYVPAGPFVMGSDPGEGGSDEGPEHIVTLSAFCVDLTEVTEGAYAACGSSGPCGIPSCLGGGIDELPQTCISWQQADIYCRWTGKRLPTEAEWEKAARGGCEMVAPATCGEEDERTYPWGEDVPTCDFALYSACGDVGRVGRHPAGDSPYGAHDMAGNVWEFVGDWYDADYYVECTAGCSDPTGAASGTERVIRGGAVTGGTWDLRTTCRWSYTATGRGGRSLGFRCASDP